MNEDNVTVTSEDGVLHFEYEGDYSEFDQALPADQEDPLEVQTGSDFDYETLVIYMQDSIELRLQQNYLLVTIAFGVYLMLGIVLAHIVWNRFLK